LITRMGEGESEGEGEGIVNDNEVVEDHRDTEKRIIDMPVEVLKKLIPEEQMRSVMDYLMKDDDPTGQKLGEVDEKFLFYHEGNATLENELQNALEKSGYSTHEFTEKWSEAWWQNFRDVLATHMEYEREKASEKRGLWGKTTDWIRTSAKDRATQALRRIGTVAAAGGSAAGLAVLSGGGAVVALTAAGAATGFTRFAQRGVKKFRDWLGKTDELAEKNIQEKKKQLSKERKESRAVKEEVQKALQELPITAIYGLLSDVIRQSSHRSLVEIEHTDTPDEQRGDYANQAILRKDFLTRITHEFQGATDAVDVVEEKPRLEARLDVILAGLYADDAARFSEALVSVVERQPKFLSVLTKISAIRGGRVAELFQKKLQSNRDQGLGERDRMELKHALEGVLSTAVGAGAGAAVGALIQSEPGFGRALLGALSGATAGAVIGAQFDSRREKKELTEDIQSLVAEAEQAIFDSGEGDTDVQGFEGVYARRIRMALNFGLIDKQRAPMLWHRAHNVLRRLEEKKYQNPEHESTPVAQLIKELELDRQAQQRAMTERLDQIKNRKKRIKGAVIGGAIGSVVGLVGGLLIGSARTTGQTETTTSDAGSQPADTRAHATPPVLETPTPPAQAQGEGEGVTTEQSSVAQESSPAVVEAEVRPEPISYLETINRGEGVLHATNRAIDNAIKENNIPELTDMSPRELRAWKMDQLKEMGFVFKDGKWGYPFTVHPGAQVELWTDPEGKPQLRVIGDEGKHVSIHRNIRYKEVVEVSEAREPLSPEDQSVVRAETEAFIRQTTTHPEDVSIQPTRPLIDTLRSDSVVDTLPAIAEIGATPDENGAVTLKLEDGREVAALPVPDPEREGVFVLHPASSDTPAVGDVGSSGMQRGQTVQWRTGEEVDVDKVRSRVISTAEWEALRTAPQAVPTPEATTTSSTAAPDSAKASGDTLSTPSDKDAGESSGTKETDALQDNEISGSFVEQSPSVVERVENEFERILKDFTTILPDASHNYAAAQKLLDAEVRRIFGASMTTIVEQLGEGKLPSVLAERLMSSGQEIDLDTIPEIFDKYLVDTMSAEAHMLTASIVDGGVDYGVQGTTQIWHEPDSKVVRIKFAGDNEGVFVLDPNDSGKIEIARINGVARLGIVRSPDGFFPIEMIQGESGSVGYRVEPVGHKEYKPLERTGA